MLQDSNPLSACAKLAQDLIARGTTLATCSQSEDCAVPAVSYAQHPPALAQASSSPRGVPVPSSQQKAVPESTGHPTCRIQTQSQPACHVTIAKAVLPDQVDDARRSGSSTTPAHNTQDAIVTKDAAQLTVRQLCNIVLQSTFVYVEAVMGLPILEVFQEQVNKAMFFDYGSVVEAADERWLSLIWSKLLQAEYSQPDQMMRDVDKIRKCAEQYHGKRQSRFRNPVVPANAKVLQTAFSQACHNVKPATDAILRGHGAANAIQQLGIMMARDQPKGCSELFRTQLLEESGATYYPLMRYAQRMYAKKLLQDPKQHANRAATAGPPTVYIPPQLWCSKPVLEPSLVNASRRASSASEVSASKSLKRPREESTMPVFDEPSFQHFCKLMKTNHGTRSSDLAAIKLELVECESRPDKHAFFLQLKNGKRHRSVKQLELEWWQRQASRQEDQQAAPSADAAASGVASAGSDMSASDGLTPNATTAAAGQCMQQGNVMSQRIDTLANMLKAGPSKVLGIPLLPERPNHHIKQPQSLTKAPAQTQPGSTAALNTQPGFSTQLEPQTQPQTQTQEPQSQTHVETHAHVQSETQHSMHQLKRTVRQHEVSQQQQAKLDSSTADEPKTAGAGEANDASSASIKTGVSGEEAREHSPATDSNEQSRQHAGSSSIDLDDDVLQQIKEHHASLRHIYRTQVRHRSNTLGLQSFTSELFAVKQESRVKQDQVLRYDKILGLLQQSMHLDDTDKRYLDETRARHAAATGSLASLHTQQRLLQARVDRAHERIRHLKVELVALLSVADFEL